MNCRHPEQVAEIEPMDEMESSWELSRWISMLKKSTSRVKDRLTVARPKEDLLYNDDLPVAIVLFRYSAYVSGWVP